MKVSLIRGRNYILLPLPFIDKVLGSLAQANSAKIDKYNLIAKTWIRRTVWEELSTANNKPYEKQVVPLTSKEFTWLKDSYDSPI